MPARRLSLLEQEQIRLLFGSGMPLVDIARHFGVSRKTVRFTVYPEKYARWKALSAVKRYQQMRRERDRAKITAQKRTWYQTHRTHAIEKTKAYDRRRSAVDPLYRLVKRLRTRICQELTCKGRAKPSASLDLVGCTRSELKAHLELKFKPGMTWATYGKWHVDHIRPVALYDLSDPAQVRACFHYTNLQPLWACENFQKKATDGSQGAAVRSRQQKAR